MLIAVDTNVLLDHANNDDDVMDAVATIRRRLPAARLVVTPTVIGELVALYERGDRSEQKAAEKALTRMREWGYEPLNLVAVAHGIVEQIGLTLRLKGALPDEEANDGCVIAEAALLGARVLLTADAHMLEAQEHPLFKKSSATATWKATISSSPHRAKSSAAFFKGDNPASQLSPLNHHATHRIPRRTQPGL